MHRARALALICFVALVQPAWAQSSPPQDDEGFRFTDWQDWITVEEEGAPEQPLLRLQVGFLAALDISTQLQADRGGLPGTRLNDLEEEQGLPGSGLGPWVELSLGRAVRAGADFSFLIRQGDYTPQAEQVAFDGKLLAEPGDLVKARVDFYNAGAFAEWDFLHGQTYRIGLVGGLRYFAFDLEMRGLRQRPTELVASSLRAELVSPFFGGLIELTPFPYLSVTTQIQFMNWSWQQFLLKRARYLRFRLGFTLRPLSWLGFGAEYRFEALRAKGRTSSSGGRQLDAGLATNSLQVNLELTF